MFILTAVQWLEMAINVRMEIILARLSFIERPSKRFLSQSSFFLLPNKLELFKTAKWNALRAELTVFYSLLSDFGKCPVPLFLLPREPEGCIPESICPQDPGFRWLLNPGSRPRGSALGRKSQTSPSAAGAECLTLCDPMACGPPGCSVHGISQARTLEWAAMPSSGLIPLDPGI